MGLVAGVTWTAIAASRCWAPAGTLKVRVMKERGEPVVFKNVGSVAGLRFKVSVSPASGAPSLFRLGARCCVLVPVLVTVKERTCGLFGRSVILVAVGLSNTLCP